MRVIFYMQLIEINGDSEGMQVEATAQESTHFHMDNDENSFDSGIGISNFPIIRRASYVEINANRPVAPVKLQEDDGSSEEPCSCKASDKKPCSRISDCLHVTCSEECDGKTCPAGQACENQKLTKGDFIPLHLINTQNRGRGVITLKDVAPNTIVIEYVGDLINSDETNRRKSIREYRDDYLFKVDDDLYIDGAFAGNLSRYINHSCDPNCITEKIKVAGNTRVAVISKEEIKAVCDLQNLYNISFHFFYLIIGN